MKKFEEYTEIPSRWMWVILVIFSACIVGWGMLHMLFIDDTERDWDFGQVPDAPAESIYTTAPTPATTDADAPQQIEPLPEAVPVDTAGTAKAEGGGSGK